MNSTPHPNPPARPARPVALVTGATRRVGLAIAAALARAGCDLIITYRSSLAAAREARQAVLRAASAAPTAAPPAAAPPDPCVELIELDLSDPARVESAGRLLADRSTGIDVLVHNASIYGPTPLASLSAADALRHFHVNALAPLMLSKHLAPALARSSLPGGGAIVAMLDIHAMGLPRSNYSAYAMSKAALHEMVRSLAKELAPRVRVNAVAPGVVAWPDQHGHEESDPAVRAAYLARVPLARAGTPDDAAEAVRWLALHARYMTGQVLRIDGGRSIE
ncbi:MAG: SDR family oxidoreductase [Phycisphaerales bacterium]